MSSLFCTLIVPPSVNLYLFNSVVLISFLMFFLVHIFFAFFREKFDFIYLSFWLGIGAIQVRYENSSVIYFFNIFSVVSAVKIRISIFL